MAGESWRRVADLVAHALELAPEQRAAYLDEACGGDLALRAEVDALLSVAPRNDFLVPPDLSKALEPHLDSGRTLAEFTLVRELGRGGWGVVFLARDRALNRDVAVKVLGPGAALSERTVERFRREARAAARLRHPGIVTVFRSDDAGGVHFIAMEFIEGKTLARVLAEATTGDGAPEPPLLPTDQSGFPRVRAVADVVASIAEALQYAHDQGVVHRDVKPQNILLDVAGRPHLVDFGLALDQTADAMSVSGELTGTYFYMSPEQALAKRALVDHRTDVFSLGTVLYEALTLTQAFAGESSREVLHRISHVAPPPIRRVNPRVPRDVEVICGRAMEKKPGDRYATAGEFAADLRRFLAHEAILARPPSIGARLARRLSRHRPILAAGTVTAALVVIGFLAAGALADRRNAEAELGRLEAVAAADGWRGTSPFVLRSALETARRLRSERRWSEERGHFLDDLLARFDAFREETRRTAAVQVRRGTEEGAGAVGDLELLLGIVALRDAAIIFPDDPEFAAMARQETPYPRITLDTMSTASGQPRSVDARGEVWVRTIDPLTDAAGPRRHVGSLPVSSHPVEAGHVRIVVELEDGTSRELTRDLRFGPREYRFTVWTDPVDPEIRNEMIELGPAELDGPPEGQFACNLVGRRLSIDAFSIQRHEVTNRDFLRFLLATRSELPVFWAEWGVDETWLRRDGWAERPASALSWLDAQAYAEWIGCRLPTHAEWEFAARGPDWVRFALDPADIAASANVGRPSPMRTGDDADVALADFLRDAVPVDSGAPVGDLYHMYGNVSELTESLLLRDVGGSLTEDPLHRVGMGCAWDGDPSRHDLGQHYARGIGKRHASITLGFRCARSRDS